MKYALITCINGNFKVESEHGENQKQAETAFFSKCTALSDAPDVESAYVKVVDENLNVVAGLERQFNNIPASEV